MSQTHPCIFYVKINESDATICSCSHGSVDVFTLINTEKIDWINKQINNWKNSAVSTSLQPISEVGLQRTTVTEDRSPVHNVEQENGGELLSSDILMQCFAFIASLLAFIASLLAVIGCILLVCKIFC